MNKIINKIDAHQHFWQLIRGDYDWLTNDLEVLYQDFLPDDLDIILKNHKIDGTVVVQAAATVAETEFLLSLADRYPFIKGVVGWIDMESEQAIADLTTLAKHHAFKGIRPMIQEIDDPKWMLKSELAPVYEKLIELNLTFDALVLPTHLDPLYELLLRYPTLQVVIDHGAKPAIAQGWEANQHWCHKLQCLAKDTKAYCKLSGLVTEAGGNIGYDNICQYIEHILNTFGSDRVMWGSDWPVVKLACEYQEWLFIFEQYIALLPEQQQQKIYNDNAKKFYQLS
ncbi:MAG: amidohydrolase family protein [Gammaproteobacteria bacterium]|nr:amidohydrolase family protein [Gammaproteobacteria bacterium]